MYHAGIGAFAYPALGAKQALFDVREHGAAGDGQAHDTQAINEAIAACAQAGGGLVVFSPGVYRTGTIRLKSQVSLQLKAGARLIGTDQLDLYQTYSPPKDVPEAGWTHWQRAIIIGDGVENVTIGGTGLIDGNKVFDPAGEENMRGPHTILLGNCRNVTIRDLTIKDSANYAILMQHSHHIDIRNIKCDGGWDGVHFRGWPAAPDRAESRPCRHITISGCQFFTGDDSIAGRYWEDVLISDCILNTARNGLRLIGPARRLIIRDCLFYGPGKNPQRAVGSHHMLAGLLLQPGAWDPTQGELDEVLISDITMHQVAAPISLIAYSKNPVGEIMISRVEAAGVYRAAFSVESWAEAPIERVTLRDIHIDYEGGGTRSLANRKATKPGVDIRPLPAWGIYARNVKTLRLEEVTLSYRKKEWRPALIGERIEHLTLNEFRFKPSEPSVLPLRLKQVSKVEVNNSDIQSITPYIQKEVDARF